MPDTPDPAADPLALRDVRVQHACFDAGQEHQKLAALGGGAVVTFTGLVRGRDAEGTGLTALHLEHYPGMTDQSMAAIVDEAVQRWPLVGVVVIHRIGELQPGAPIVFVGTASSHRVAAFEAASFLMDYLKTRAVFWKQERAADGSGRWVESSAGDHAAAAGWQQPAGR